MNWIVRRAVPVFAAAFFAAPLFADTITLTNDKVLEGHAIENDNGDVTVELPQGTIRLKRSQIKSIVRKDTPLEEFGRRSADLQKKIKDGELETPAQIKSWTELAQWAGDNQLARNREDAFKKVIELDPENATAREGLGYVFLQGKWMTATERNLALGLVRYEGRWITKEALADIKASRDKQEAKLAQAERAQAEADLKEAQIQKLQAERDLLNAQREQYNQQVAQQEPVYVPVPVPLYSNGLPFPYGPIASASPVPYTPVRPIYPTYPTRPIQPAQPLPSGNGSVTTSPGLQPPNLLTPPTQRPPLPTPGKLPAPTTPPSQMLQPTPPPAPALPPPTPGSRDL